MPRSVGSSRLPYGRLLRSLWDLTRRGEWAKAREIYQWFTPLLHLDTHPKFVQYIKLAVQECGLGAEWTRAPRLTLVGEERSHIVDAGKIADEPAR